MSTANSQLDSAAGSQVMRGVRGEAGAAETASSVLAVMLELELRGALDVVRVCCTHTHTHMHTRTHARAFVPATFPLLEEVGCP
eukprot:scaffold49370_cov23-Tisochrysis_lutea.AAC.3